MTETEAKVLKLALEWIDARYAVEEALIRQEFQREIRRLKKERSKEVTTGPDEKSTA